jgi:hypothetical protein
VGTSSPTVAERLVIASFMRSCIFDWSSWLSRRCFSASFFCSWALFWATAVLA